MASLCDKVKITLDENRMLVLGTQVLISLQFELAFQGGFPQAPALTQQLVPIGLALLLATFILLLWGPAYHRIVARGQCNEESLAFMTRAICGALWPLALALALDSFIAFDLLVGVAAGIAAAVVLLILCAGLWYVMAAVARQRRPPEARTMRSEQQKREEREQGAKLHERVSQVLTEARVVLPGAQAMLGFQFVTMFEKQFELLPASSKLVHLASLCLIALTVVLLMTPAAFHRIAEAGEDSERLVKVASRLVVLAMAPLAAGIAGDFYVVVRKITDSLPLAIAAACVTLAAAFGMWFLYTTVVRRRRTAPAHPNVSALPHPG